MSGSLKSLVVQKVAGVGFETTVFPLNFKAEHSLL